MSLESIQSRIENVGYFTYFRNGSLIVGKFVEVSAIAKFTISDYYCSVGIQDNKYFVEYYPYSLPIFEYFDSESQVIAFIKKQFPL